MKIKYEFIKIEVTNGYFSHTLSDESKVEDLDKIINDCRNNERGLTVRGYKDKQVIGRDILRIPFDDMKNFDFTSIAYLQNIVSNLYLMYFGENAYGDEKEWGVNCDPPKKASD